MFVLAPPCGSGDVVTGCYCSSSSSDVFLKDHRPTPISFNSCICEFSSGDPAIQTINAKAVCLSALSKKDAGEEEFDEQEPLFDEEELDLAVTIDELRGEIQALEQWQIQWLEAEQEHEGGGHE